MKNVWKLILKEYRLFWSDRVAVSLTFLIPMLLIALWGAIFGRADSVPQRPRIGFLNLSEAPVAKKIERVLDTASLKESMRKETHRPRSLFRKMLTVIRQLN